MSEPMGVRVELWMLAADGTGIWLVSGGDAWRTARIDADSFVQTEVSCWRPSTCPASCCR